MRAYSGRKYATYHIYLTLAELEMLQTLLESAGYANDPALRHFQEFVLPAKIATCKEKLV